MAKSDKTTSKKRRIDTSWHDVFIRSLQQAPNVVIACKKAGIDRDTAYRHKKRFKTFSDAWEEAINSGVESLEAALLSRAVTSSDTLGIYLHKYYTRDRELNRLQIEKAKAEIESLKKGTEIADKPVLIQWVNE